MARLKTVHFEDGSVGIDKDSSAEFSIDTQDSFIFDILRDRMYKDKIGAVVREVSSNARDANREAGRADTPIKISLYDSNDSNDNTDDGQLLSILGMQTIDSSQLVIEDRGIGITPDRMENVFMIYGRSTKRDSNGQTGGFGLGAKTPFAYTDVFNIITVCDWEDPDTGKTTRLKSHYTAIIDGSRKGQMHLIESIEVSGLVPTGTKIIIPINNDDVYQFERSINRFCGLFDPLPILSKNLEFNNKLAEELIPLYGKGYTLKGTSTNNPLTLLIDKIPYAFNDIETLYNNGVERDIPEHNLSGFLQHSDKIALSFETGVLTIGPSREVVEQDDDTLNAIYEAIAHIYSELTKEASDLLYNLPKEDLFRLRSHIDRHSSDYYVFDRKDGALKIIDRFIRTKLITQGGLEQVMRERDILDEYRFLKGFRLPVKLYKLQSAFQEPNGAMYGRVHEDSSNYPFRCTMKRGIGTVLTFSDKNKRPLTRIKKLLETHDEVIVIDSLPEVSNDIALHKALNLYSRDIKDIWAIEPQKPLASDKTVYTKQPTVSVNLRSIGMAGNFWVREHSTVAEVDRKEKTWDHEQETVLIPVSKISEYTQEHSRGMSGLPKETYNQIKVLGHLNPEIKFYLIRTAQLKWMTNVRTLEDYVNEGYFDRADYFKEIYLSEVKKAKIKYAAQEIRSHSGLTGRDIKTLAGAGVGCMVQLNTMLSHEPAETALRESIRSFAGDGSTQTFSFSEILKEELAIECTKVRNAYHTFLDKPKSVSDLFSKKSPKRIPFKGGTLKRQYKQVG